VGCQRERRRPNKALLLSALTSGRARATLTLAADKVRQQNAKSLGRGVWGPTIRLTAVPPLPHREATNSRDASQAQCAASGSLLVATQRVPRCNEHRDATQVATRGGPRCVAARDTSRSRDAWRIAMHR